MPGIICLFQVFIYYIFAKGSLLMGELGPYARWSITLGLVFN